MHDKQLPVETVRLILLLAESYSTVRGHSRQGAIFSQKVVLKESKRSRTVSAEAKCDGQSRQETKNWLTSLYPVIIGFEAIGRALDNYCI